MHRAAGCSQLMVSGLDNIVLLPGNDLVLIILQLIINRYIMSITSQLEFQFCFSTRGRVISSCSLLKTDLHQPHYCWHRHCCLPKAVPPINSFKRQHVTNSTLQRSNTNFPWHAKSCWFSTCERSRWSRQWWVQAAVSWKSGRSEGGRRGGGEESKETSVGSVAVGAAWWASCETFVWATSRMVFMSVCNAGGVLSCSCFCFRWRISRYPEFPLRWLQDSSGEVDKKFIFVVHKISNLLSDEQRRRRHALWSLSS